MNEEAKRVRRFADQFDVVGIKEVPAMGVVEVKVTFDTDPTKEYDFIINEEDFDTDKFVIAEEILKQLKT